MTRPVLVVLLVVAVAWLGFRAVRAFDTDRHAAEAAAVLAAPDVVTHELPPVAGGQPPPPPRAGGAPNGQPSPRPSVAGAPKGGRPSSPPSVAGAPKGGRPSSPPAVAGAPNREGSRPPGGLGTAVHSPATPPASPATRAGGRLSYRPGVWLSVVELRGLAPVAGGERYLVFLRNWAGWTLAGAARSGPDGTAQVRSAAEPRPPTIYEVVVTRGVDDATSVPHGRPVLHWFDASLAPPRARQFDFARGA